MALISGSVAVLARPRPATLGKNHRSAGVRGAACLLLAAAAAALPYGAQAQDARRAADRPDGSAAIGAPAAWMGIRTVETRLSADGSSFGLRIVDVHPEGPSARPGVLVRGDVILSVNGERLRGIGDWQSVTAGLLPGASVLMRVLRGEHLVEVGVRAEPRPNPVRSPASSSVRMDSLVERIARRVDSIYGLAGLDPAGRQSRAPVAVPDPNERLLAAEEQLRIRWRAAAAGAATRSETDLLERSSREAMLRVNEGENPPVAGGGAGGAAPGQDQAALLPIHDLPLWGQVVLLGGIRVVDLPLRALRSVFAVDAGVLAAAVPKGSIAAQAGFVSGDVIVAVGGRPVRTVSELRSALAATDLPTAVTVVRQRDGIERDLVYPPDRRR